MPIVSTVFRVLSAPIDERDTIALDEKRMLQRGYFSFLSTLVTNNVTEVLKNQGTGIPLPRLFLHFSHSPPPPLQVIYVTKLVCYISAIDDLHKVLLTVVQGAVDIPDPPSQKTCFNVLRRLVETWADQGNGLNGFSDFLYQQIVPACFVAPTKPTFDLSDAQTCLV